MDKKKKDTTNEFKTNSSNFFKDKNPDVQQKDEKLTEMKSVQLENNNVLSLNQTSNGERKYSAISDKSSNNEQSGNPSTVLVGSNFSYGVNAVEKKASVMGFSENFKIDFSSKTGLVRVYGRVSNTFGEISEKKAGKSNFSSLVQATCDESEISTDSHRWFSFKEDTSKILEFKKSIQNSRFSSKNVSKYSSSTSQSDILPKIMESDEKLRQMSDVKVFSRVAFGGRSSRNCEMVDSQTDTLYSLENVNAVAGPSGIRTSLYEKESKYRFACNLCGKEFAEGWEFDIHYQKNHWKEKASVCNERNRKITDRNYRAHTREKPYASKVSKKETTRHGNQENNYRTNTGNNRFTCDICQRIFRRQDILDNHYLASH